MQKVQRVRPAPVIEVALHASCSRRLRGGSGNAAAGSALKLLPRAMPSPTLPGLLHAAAPKAPTSCWYPLHPALPLLLPQVEEIALLKTVLVRWDGARIYYPNNKLNTELLLNLSRSANKSESLKVGGRLATSLPCPVLACPNEPCCCKQCDRAECTTGKPCARSPPALPLCLILPPPACPACSCLWTWTPRWRWWKCCGGLWRHMCAPIHQSSPATAQVGWGLSVGLGGCGSVLPVGWGRQCLAKLRLRHMAGLACNLSWGLLPTTS